MTELDEETIFPTMVDEHIDPEDVVGMNVRDLYDNIDGIHVTTATKAKLLSAYHNPAGLVDGELVQLS